MYNLPQKEKKWHISNPSSDNGKQKHYLRANPIKVRTRLGVTKSFVFTDSIRHTFERRHNPITNNEKIFYRNNYYPSLAYPHTPGRHFDCQSNFTTLIKEVGRYEAGSCNRFHVCAEKQSVTCMLCCVVLASDVQTGWGLGKWVCCPRPRDRVRPRNGSLPGLEL